MTNQKDMKELKINGKAIYSTKGAAREYGRIGCNFYTGCPHGCEYCYLKRGAPSKQLGGNVVKLKKCFKDEEHAAEVLRYELAKNIEQCQKYGIFLSFTTDPLIEQTRNLTSISITESLMLDIPVWVLTKDATFIKDESNFMAWMRAINPLYRERIHFGFTLTGRDDMEPNASTNEERIQAMRVLYAMGFSTFASIEPVIDWGAALMMVYVSLPYCDHYMIGLRSGVKKDYYDCVQSYIAIEHIVKPIEAEGKTVYLKESTRKLLHQVLKPGAYEALISHTVDMNGLCSGLQQTSAEMHPKKD